MLAVNTFNMHIPVIIRDGFCSNIVAVSFRFPLINPSLACCSCLLHFCRSDCLISLCACCVYYALRFCGIFTFSCVLWSWWGLRVSTFCGCGLAEFSAYYWPVPSMNSLHFVVLWLLCVFYVLCPVDTVRFLRFVVPWSCWVLFFEFCGLLSLHAVFRGWRAPTILMDTSHYCMTLSVLSVCTHGILQHSPQFVSRYSFSLLHSSRPCGPESWI